MRRSGEIKWKGRLVYVNQALAGEPVALIEDDEGLWQSDTAPSSSASSTIVARDCNDRNKNPTATRHEQKKKPVTHVAGLFRYLCPRLLRGRG